MFILFSYVCGCWKSVLKFGRMLSNGYAYMENYERNFKWKIKWMQQFVCRWKFCDDISLIFAFALCFSVLRMQIVYFLFTRTSYVFLLCFDCFVFVVFDIPQFLCTYALYMYYSYGLMNRSIYLISMHIYAICIYLFSAFYTLFSAFFFVMRKNRKCNDFFPFFLFTFALFSISLCWLSTNDIEYRFVSWKMYMLSAGCRVFFE